MTALQELSPDEIQALKHAAASKGRLRHLLRPHGQLRTYLKIKAWKEANPRRHGPIVLETHRRFGKSYCMTLMGFERCIARANQIVRYGAPSLTQCKDFIEPIIAEIMYHLPESVRPKRKADTWIFQHKLGDSRFVLIGCRENADAHRGKASDVVLLDEARDIENFSYVCGTVFGPHFIRRRDPLLMIASTPPESMDHPFIQTYIPEAQVRGTHFLETVLTNEDWSEEDDQLLRESFPDEISYRREGLCEHVGDPKGLIVPEWVEVEQAGALDEVYVEQHKRPSHYHPFVAIDGGFVDYTGVLFGFVDFLEQKLVILDELWERQLESVAWKDKILAKERELFSGAPHPVVRIGDLPKQQQADLALTFKFPVLPVDKYDKESALAKLRSTIRAKKLKILKACRHLPYQLRNGIYAKNRKDFVRSESLGHCDLIDALIYLHRAAYWNSNPFPIAGFQLMDTFIPAEDDQPDVLRVLGEREYRIA